MWPTVSHKPPAFPGSSGSRGGTPSPLLSFMEADATKDGPWSVDPITAPRHRRMIRNTEYPLVWHNLKMIIENERQEEKCLLLCGHPGIGKSMLLDVLLSWSLHEYPLQPVVVVTSAWIEVFAKRRDGVEKRFTFDEGHPPWAALAKALLHDVGLVAGTQLLIIHDTINIMGGATTNPNCFLFQRDFLLHIKKHFQVACCVAATSLSLHGNDSGIAVVFPGGARTLHLPVLTLEEVEELFCVSEYGAKTAGRLVSAEGGDSIVKRTCLRQQAVELYHYVGGVLANLRSQNALDEAITAQKQLENLDFTPGSRPNCMPSTSIHCLISAIPSPDRRHIDSFDFVSQHARQLWCSNAAINNTKVKLFSDLLVVAPLPSHLPATHRAVNQARQETIDRFFEQWFINLLSKWSAYPLLLSFCELFCDGSCGSLQPWSPLTSRNSHVVYFHNVADILNQLPHRDSAQSTIFLPFRTRCGDALANGRECSAILVGSDGDLYFVSTATATNINGAAAGNDHDQFLSELLEGLERGGGGGGNTAVKGRVLVVPHIVQGVDEQQQQQQQDDEESEMEPSRPINNLDVHKTGTVPLYLCRVASETTYVQRIADERLLTMKRKRKKEQDGLTMNTSSSGGGAPPPLAIGGHYSTKKKLVRAIQRCCGGCNGGVPNFSTADGSVDDPYLFTPHHS